MTVNYESVKVTVRIPQKDMLSLMFDAELNQISEHLACILIQC